MNSFNFPFTTCEKEKEGYIKQPVSFTVNILSCMILLYFLNIAKSTSVRMMIIVFLIFQSWHAFSHMFHIHNNMQALTIHIISYAVSFATLNALLYLSKSQISYVYIGILFILIAIDLYVWRYIGGVWSVYTNLIILAFIVFGNYTKLPAFFKNAIPSLVFGLLILFALEYNEVVHCKHMLEYYEFPYHVFIEIVGLFLFSYLVYLFTHWEYLYKAY